MDQTTQNFPKPASPKWVKDFQAVNHVQLEAFCTASQKTWSTEKSKTGNLHSFVELGVVSHQWRSFFRKHYEKTTKLKVGGPSGGQTEFTNCENIFLTWPFFVLKHYDHEIHPDFWLPLWNTYNFHEIEYSMLKNEIPTTLQGLGFLVCWEFMLTINLEWWRWPP